MMAFKPEVRKLAYEEYEKNSIANQLDRMDSIISNGSNDSSLNSMEIDDNFVGMNLDKNSNETESNNNDVS